MNYQEICLDEIALEGLEGITLQGLWLRIGDREPKVPLKLDPLSKEYLWKCFVGHPELQFFELPKPRGDLHVYDRFEHLDPDTGICLEVKLDFEDIYQPIVNVNKDGVIGSCSTYDTRKDISNKIKSEDGDILMSVSEAEAKWGNSLVIVASQQMRNKAILGDEVLIDALYGNERQFILLERIGRARHYGEVTRGNPSLQVFKDSVKTVFYLRKKLSKKGLITTQMFSQKLLKGLNVSAKLIHLKRFFRERKPVYLGLLEKLTHRLLQKPGQREPLTQCREEMGMKDKTFKKLYQLGSKYVKTEMVAFSELYPQSSENEYLIKTKTKERQVRVIQLKKTYTYKHGASHLEDDDDEDDEEGEIDNEPDAPSTAEQTVDVVYERPLLHQAARFVVGQAERGVSQAQIAKVFQIGSLEARLLCRAFERYRFARRLMHDIGRQRVQIFVSKRFADSNNVHKKLEEERIKIQVHGNIFSDAVTDDKDSDVSTNVPSRCSTPVTTPRKLPPGTPSHSNDSVCIPSDQDTPSSAHFHHAKKRNAHITYRMLKRANIVLSAIKKAKVVDNLFFIQKEIKDIESTEGHKYVLDKKSLVRLCLRLEGEGKINIFRFKVGLPGEEKEVRLYCDPSLTEDDPQVKIAMESAKNRHLALDKELTKSIIRQTKADMWAVSDPENPNHALLTSQLKVKDMTYDSEAGKRYGYLPKMQRCYLIHEYLWYLTWDYESHRQRATVASSEGSDTGTEQEESSASTAIPLKVYCNEMSWRRFIPPLQKHSDYPQGWCLLGDVLLCLPLSLYCKVIRMNFKIPGLEDLLKDPERRHILVSCLPTKMRQMLFCERKYIHSFYEACQSLCLMGLLSFGKRDFKNKEQIFIYLHQKASIIDTTITDMPVEEKPVLLHHLTTPEKFQEYWFKLQCVCLNTPLDEITIKNVANGRGMDQAHRFERFKDTLAGKEVETIVDEGILPGDKDGAAGLDTAFFSHLRRNWSWNPSGDAKVESIITYQNEMKEDADWEPTPKKKASAAVKKKSPKEKEEKGKAVKKKKESPKVKKMVVPVEFVKAMKGGAGLKRKRKKSVSEEHKPPEKKKKTTKRVQRTRNHYDDLDKTALTKKKSERVNWSTREDSLLLLMKVAHVFMAGHRRDFIIPFSVIRDILHANYQESEDKTTVACHRRLHYMMKKEGTQTNVLAYAGEAEQDNVLYMQYKHNKKYTNSPAHHESNSEVFKALVQDLRAKFTGDKDIVSATVKPWIPDTVKEIFEKYTVNEGTLLSTSSHSDVTCSKDIEYSVLHNIIHSSMLLKKKEGTAYYLYNLFKKYHEDTLHHVFGNVKRDGIVTKIKQTGSKSNSKATTVPNVAMGTYQLAQKYCYKWNSRYPRKVFDHSFEYLDTLGKNEEVKLLEQGGLAALTASLMAGKKAKFETTIPERIVTVKCKKGKKAEGTEKPDEGNETEDEFMDYNFTGERPNVQNASRTKMMIKNSDEIKVLSTQEKLYLVSCDVRIIERPPFNDVTNLPQKGPPNSKPETVFHREIKAHNRQGIWLHPSTAAAICQILRRTQPTLISVENVTQELTNKWKFCPTDVTNIMNIFGVIDEEKSVGITNLEYLTKFKGHEKSDDYLAALIEEQMILSVGVTQRRYVSYNYAEPWTIHSFKRHDTSPQSKITAYNGDIPVSEGSPLTVEQEDTTTKQNSTNEDEGQSLEELRSKAVTSSAGGEMDSVIYYVPLEKQNRNPPTVETSEEKDEVGEGDKEVAYEMGESLIEDSTKLAELEETQPMDITESEVTVSEIAMDEGQAELLLNLIEDKTVDNVVSIEEVATDKTLEAKLESGQKGKKSKSTVSRMKSIKDKQQGNVTQIGGRSQWSNMITSLRSTMQTSMKATPQKEKAVKSSMVSVSEESLKAHLSSAAIDSLEKKRAVKDRNIKEKNPKPPHTPKATGTIDKREHSRSASVDSSEKRQALKDTNVTEKTPKPPYTPQSTIDKMNVKKPPQTVQINFKYIRSDSQAISRKNETEVSEEPTKEKRIFPPRKKKTAASSTKSPAPAATKEPVPKSSPQAPVPGQTTITLPPGTSISDFIKEKFSGSQQVKVVTESEAKKMGLIQGQSSQSKEADSLIRRKSTDQIESIIDKPHMASDKKYDGDKIQNQVDGAWDDHDEDTPSGNNDKKLTGSNENTDNTLQDIDILPLREWLLPQFDGTGDETSQQGQSKKGGERKRGRRKPLLHEDLDAETPQEQEGTRLVCRPWKTPDGALNRPILKVMSEAVLAYILVKPGLRKEMLDKKFTPALQPICLEEILEILDAIGCLKKVALERKKASLFSKRQSISEATEEKESTIFTYTPTHDAILKLGQFSQQLDKLDYRNC